MESVDVSQASTHAGQPRAVPGPPPHRRPGLLRQLEKDPLATLRRIHRDYGDIVRLNLLVVDIYLVVHPEHVRHVLQERHTNYNKDTFDWRMLKPVVGEGLLTSDGATWLRQRRLMQPAFHRRRIEELVPLMAGCAAATRERWKALAGREVDVFAEMTRLTLDIVTRALFGVDVGGGAETVANAFTTLSRGAMQSYFSPLVAIPGVSLLVHREARQAKRDIDAMVMDIIARRRAAAPVPSSGDDLLGILLAARDEESGAGMSDAQLRDEVLTLMIAGHETTASALSWAWYLLAQHGDVFARLRGELAAQLQGRDPTIADLPHLPYTRMVLEESMRLYPPAWATSRAAVAADEIGPYPIPAGALIFLSQYLTHRHPDFWERPDDFDPERFSAERVAARPRYAYFPFGGGPRQCIGNTFALTEAILVLATLAAHFTPVLTERQPIPEALITLRPRDGLWLKLERS